MKRLAMVMGAMLAMACGGTAEMARPSSSASVVTTQPNGGYCQTHECYCQVSGTTTRIVIDKCDAPIADFDLDGACAATFGSQACACDHAENVCGDAP